MTTTTKRKSKQAVKNMPKLDAKHKAMVDSLYGSMHWMKLTVDGYLCEKHSETDSENET